MSITITDPVLLDQIRQASGVVDVRDPDGRVIAAITVPNEGRMPPSVKSPFTPDQLAEFRKQRTGRPLADILRDIGAQE